jgi:hypothetical protein
MSASIHSKAPQTAIAEVPAKVAQTRYKQDVLCNDSLLSRVLHFTSGSQIIRSQQNTGLFISPSGISASCGTVAGMVTPKGSMSTEGETLQVSVLP